MSIISVDGLTVIGFPLYHRDIKIKDIRINPSDRKICGLSVGHVKKIQRRMAKAKIYHLVLEDSLGNKAKIGSYFALSFEQAAKCAAKSLFGHLELRAQWFICDQFGARLTLHDCLRATR